MKDNEGNILKPVPHSGPAEIDFYEDLANTDDYILQQLREFVPPYMGTVIVKFEDGGLFSSNLLGLLSMDLRILFTFECSYIAQTLPVYV